MAHSPLAVRSRAPVVPPCAWQAADTTASSAPNVMELRADPEEQQLTMEEYYDEAEGQWDALAAELRATRGALAAPAGLPASPCS